MIRDSAYHDLKQGLVKWNKGTKNVLNGLMVQEKALEFATLPQQQNWLNHLSFFAITVI